MIVPWRDQAGVSWVWTNAFVNGTQARFLTSTMTKISYAGYLVSEIVQQTIWLIGFIPHLFRHARRARRASHEPIGESPFRRPLGAPLPAAPPCMRHRLFPATFCARHGRDGKSRLTSRCCLSMEWAAQRPRCRSAALWRGSTTSRRRSWSCSSRPSPIPGRSDCRHWRWRSRRRCRLAARWTFGQALI